MNDIPLRVALSKRGDVITETQEPVEKRNRPVFADEVTDPAIWVATLAFIGAGGFAILALFVVGAPINEWAIWLIIGVACAAGGSSGVLMMWWGKMNYNRLRWKYHRTYIEDKPRQETRGRILTDHGQGRRTLTRCKAPHDWQQRIARRVYNDRGEWVGGDKPVRRHIERIITDWGEKFRSEDIHKDLHDLEWLTEPTKHGKWTEKARADLRAVLFRPYEGIET